MRVNPTLIGKHCQIVDNSYSYTIETEECPMLALTMSNDLKERPICKIVSEPYLMEVVTVKGFEVMAFITVSYDDLLHVVLNYIDLV